MTAHHSNMGRRNDGDGAAPDHPIDRRGFNETQIRQLQEMVRGSVAEQIEARTKEEIDTIAEQAASRAVQKMTDEAYKMVGKSVLNKLLWLIGLMVMGLYLWLDKHGMVPKP